MTDWSLCFICQKITADNLRSNDDGLETLAANIPQFDELGKLTFDLNRIKDGDTDLLTLFKNENCRAKYHHKCALQFSNSRLTRLKAPKRREPKDSDPSNSEQDEVPRKSSRKSADNMEIPKEDQLRCCWCLEVDDSSNLRAPGQQQASKNPTKKEKKEKARQIAAITAEWKKIAAVMEHDYVLCHTESQCLLCLATER